jgi:peroxiredoxin Q/BCP
MRMSVRKIHAFAHSGLRAAQRVAGVMLLLAIGVACLSATAVARADSAEVGQPAPPFELVGSDGETYTLSRFTGKQAVVLAWFPKAFTPG